MAAKESKIFRTRALERMSSPDNLERLTPIVHSRDWIMLAVVAVLFVLGGAWCLFGSIPTTVTGRGILLETSDTAVDRGSGLCGVAYFPVGDGKKVVPGMAIQIIPDNVERERFGGLIGVVTSVSAMPVTREAVLGRIGNRDVAEELLGSGAHIEVTASLTSDPRTYSGYRWTSVKGPGVKMSAGLTNVTRVVVERRAPVDYLLPILRDSAGLY